MTENPPEKYEIKQRVPEGANLIDLLNSFCANWKKVTFNQRKFLSKVINVKKHRSFVLAACGHIPSIFWDIQGCNCPKIIAVIKYVRFLWSYRKLNNIIRWSSCNYWFSIRSVGSAPNSTTLLNKLTHGSRFSLQDGVCAYPKWWWFCHERQSSFREVLLGWTEHSQSRAHGPSKY